MSKPNFTTETPETWSTADKQLLGFVLTMQQEMMGAVIHLLRMIEPETFPERVTQDVLDRWFDRMRQIAEEDLAVKVSPKRESEVDPK